MLAALPGLGGAFDGGPLPGKTVGEALELARKWDVEAKAREAATKAKEREAEALRQRALEERKIAQERLANVISVALVKKEVLGSEYQAGRLFDELRLHFALENKTARPIVMVKGSVVFFDATGNRIDDLPVEFNEKLEAGKVVQSTGRGVLGFWRLRCSKLSRNARQISAERLFSTAFGEDGAAARHWQVYVFDISAFPI